MRLHVCWGNYEGPHTHDVELAPLLPEIYRAKVGGLVLSMANPRHAHEHRVLAQHPLPRDWLLVAGVIDTTTNYVEHPEVVAERLERAAAAVGDARRVLAGTDCGFATSAGLGEVAEELVWEKLRSLARGRGAGDQAPALAPAQPQEVAQVEHAFAHALLLQIAQAPLEQVDQAHQPDDAAALGALDHGCDRDAPLREQMRRLAQGQVGVTHLGKVQAELRQRALGPVRRESARISSLRVTKPTSRFSSSITG